LSIVCDKLAEVMIINTNQLLNKGRNAKAFFLEKKNNNIQGKKIVEFIKGIL
jgi:hypothetical protein